MRLHLEITGKCNLQCVYCYNAQYNRPETIKTEINPEFWLKVIDQANQLHCRRFTISGGEPFLVSELFDFIERCQAPVIVFTNATLLTPELISKMEAVPSLKGLRISLDGFKTHDKFRPNSNSREIVSKVELFKNSRLTIGITTMLSADILFELVDLYETVKQLPVEHWRIDIPFFTGGYLESSDCFEQASFSDIVITCRDVIFRYIRDGKPFHLGIANIYKSQIVDVFYGEFSSAIHPCSYDDVICIKANGDITVCAAYNLVLGNIKQHKTLQGALQLISSHPFYSIKISDIQECLGCRYLRLCGGGCRADAYYLRGSDLLPDAVCCSIWPLVEQEIFPILPTIEKECMVKLIKTDGRIPRTFKHIQDILAERISNN